MSYSPSARGSQYAASTGYSYTGSAGTDYTVATQYTQSQGGYYNMLPNPTPGTFRLPCEFVGLGSCDETFNYDETEAWIEHIIVNHLKDKLPSKAVCWFCDEYPFDAKAPQVRDRRLNFHNRMEHIRDHIVSEGKTANDIRPDFHMLDHLRQHGLIPETTYHQVRRWHEPSLPPENMRHVYRRDYIPPERRVQQEFSNRVLIDHSKEERQRKKERKGRSGAPRR
ncbi:hypothetical protein F4776DRAFT_503703 [Hypoxylon sp. NC0597]|nr:hypothetical protein F4776DRAFT_503703 [Hypoxylon sp. NC0597]